MKDSLSLIRKYIPSILFGCTSAEISISGKFTFVNIVEKRLSENLAGPIIFS